MKVARRLRGVGKGSLDSRSDKTGTAGMTVPDCAQNVPVKVKYYQTFPNETKNRIKIECEINALKVWFFLPQKKWDSKSTGGDPVPVRFRAPHHKNKRRVMVGMNNGRGSFLFLGLAQK